MCPHKTSPFLCRADVTAPITLRQVLRAVGRLRAEPFLQRPKSCSCSLTSFLTASRMMLSRLRSMQMLESSTVLRHRIIHMIIHDTHRAHSCMRYDHPYLQHYPRIQDSPPPSLLKLSGTEHLLLIFQDRGIFGLLSLGK